jgi:hypothetical protein
MESGKRFYRISRQQIGHLRFILEGYEGIATLTTIDPVQGRILLLVPPGCDDEVDSLLSDLAGDIYLEPEKNTPQIKPTS